MFLVLYTVAGFPKAETLTEVQTVRLLKRLAKQAIDATAVQKFAGEGGGRTFRKEDGSWGWELTTIRKRRTA
jgi:hypothetical protein